jgi:hypothetical protein
MKLLFRTEEIMLFFLGSYLFGIFLSLPLLQLSGLISFSHSAIDRGLGYGPKYYRGFGFTLPGEIGNNNG